MAGRNKKITGRGKKTCPKCKSTVGCRKLICDCGHEFIAAEKVSIPVEISFDEKVGSAFKSLGYSGLMLLTPAGRCPIKVKSIDEIESWFYDVIEAGQSKGLFYTPAAIKYFAAEFFPPHTKEWQIARQAIDDLVVMRLGDVYNIL